MSHRKLSLVLHIAMGVVLLGFTAAAARAQVGRTALAGQVSSEKEGPMEGVLVSAKKAGSTITITVVSDQQGRYRFPASKLDPGSYALSIRAVGYDLEAPATVDVAAGKAAAADLKLRTTTNLAPQLTNTEWLMSFPGTPEQKATANTCTHCHTLERVARSIYGPAELEPIIARMQSYPASSFPLMPQPRPVNRRGGGPMTPERLERQNEARGKLAQYLSTVNLSKGPEWGYEFKTLPRPKGRATRVVITEYDLPKRTRQAHDVVLDSSGMAWYASFGEQILGKLDPKTGKVTEYAAPTTKPEQGTGTLALRIDKDQNLWLGMISQGAVAKFDPKTEKFQTFMLPPDKDADYREFNNIATSNHHVDGKVWFIDSGTWYIYRLDLATNKWEEFEPFPVPRPNVYDIASDSRNNAFFTVFGDDRIGRIDAKTGAITFYKTPTERSGPRRAMIDGQDRVWFSENRAGKVGMLDPKSGKIQEWTPPTPLSYTYSVFGDKNGEAWAATEYTDRVLRLNSKTGESTEYLLPRHTNMRSTWVDNSTNPVTFWVGNNHGGSIVKVEPMD